MSPEGLASLLRGLADQTDTHAETLRILAEELEPVSIDVPPSLDLLACYFILHRQKIWGKGETIRTIAEAHGVSPKDLHDEIWCQAESAGMDVSSRPGCADLGLVLEGGGADES